MPNAALYPAKGVSKYHVVLDFSSPGLVHV